MHQIIETLFILLAVICYLFALQKVYFCEI